jgi:uncharacterized protein YajQ (UPF0234 family)
MDDKTTRGLRMAQARQMLVEVVGQVDADAVELDRLARQLRRWLLESEVDVKSAKVGEAAPGAKSGDHAAIGTLVVLALTSRAFLTSVIKAIQAYVEASKARSVKLQIDGDCLEVTGIRSDDQTALITSFVDRHTHPRT